MNDEKKKAVNDFVLKAGLPSGWSSHNMNDVRELLYSMGELGLWPDNVDSVGLDQALDCWRVIESLQGRRLPDDLRM